MSQKASLYQKLGYGEELNRLGLCPHGAGSLVKGTDTT